MEKRLIICRRFHFDAAHCLPNHEGKCKNLHGHRWAVDVAITGPVNREGAQDGMVYDFGNLKKAVDPVIEELDHHYLNDLLPFTPTAENLAESLYIHINNRLPLEVGVVFIRVWETEDSYAEYGKI